MDFVVPKNIPPIATYRIMNSDGVIEDEKLAPEGVTNDQIIEWYKNMLTGMLAGVDCPSYMTKFLTVHQLVFSIRSCQKRRDKADLAFIWYISRKKSISYQAHRSSRFRLAKKASPSALLRH